MKYLSMSITSIGISRDDINVRVQCTFKTKTESLFLTSSGKLFHSLIEDDKKN